MRSRRPATPDPEIERRFVEGARFTAEFHMGESKVHQALAQLTDRLAALDIPYAILGGLALNAYAYTRATIDVDVLLTAEGLARFKAASVGRGYLEKFPGSQELRDTAHAVEIDVVLTGDYPGDGLEKAIAFPDPGECAVPGESFSLVPFATLVELKIASGMSAPHRLRDPADVIELIRVNRLSREYGDELAPYVRAKYRELWQAAQGGADEI